MTLLLVMKRYLSAFLISLCCACSPIEEQQGVPNPTPPVFKTDAKDMTFTADGGVQSFNIVSPTSWEVTSSETFVTIAPQSGEGGSNSVTITVSVSANSTENSRTASVSIFSDAEQQAVFNILQDGQPLLPPDDDQDLIKSFRLVYRSDAPGELQLANTSLMFNSKEAEIIKIDYGDGEIEETDRMKLQHFYETSGEHTVTIYYKGNPTCFENSGSSSDVLGCMHGNWGYCVPLTKIEYPSSFTEFDYFKNGAPHLEEITFKGNIPENGYPFRDCGAISRINSDYSPDGRTLIKDGVLLLCTRRGHESEEYIVPEGVHTIGPIAFNKAEIRKVTLPKSIRKIGNEAFYSSTVEEILIPSGLEEICYWAFNSTPLKHIELPSSVKKIGENCFSGCKQLESAKLSCNTVKDMFWSCSNLKRVDFGDGITEIGEYTFKSCTSLRQITLPQSLSKIKRGAFSKTSIESIFIPKSVRTIEDFVFSDCSRLSEVVFEKGIGIMSFRENLFENCISLVSITIPNSVQSIFEGAFYGCSNLSDIRFEEGSTLSHLGERLFMGTSVRSIDLPEGMTSIPDYAFSDCSTLETIVIPSTVLSIGKYAFRNTPLSRIIIPDSVKSIGANAFLGCGGTSGLDLHIGKGLSALEPSAIYSCSTLSTIQSTSPHFITTEDRHCLVRVSDGTLLAYTSNAADEIYEIPSSTNGINITKIGQYVFSNARLHTITLPETITQLGLRCMTNAYLKKVYLKGSVPPSLEFTSGSITEGGFSMIGNGHPPIPDSVTIYVPSSSVTDYENLAWRVTGY